MKQRILLIVAMLLIAAPAFATVKIDVTQGTGNDVNKLTVSYDCNGSPVEQVRAFALTFALGSAGNSMVFSRAEPNQDQNDVNDFFRGECNETNRGYGIFPGQFKNRIDPGNPNWRDVYYTPIAPPNDVDACSTGLGMRTIIAELGTLYVDDNTPASSGTLFTVRVTDPNHKVTDTLHVSANTVRGGVVLNSGATATDTNLPFDKTITIPPIGCTVPDLNGMTMSDANTAISNAGFTNPPTISYASNCAVALGKVYSQVQAANTIIDCGTSIQYTASIPCKGDSDNNVKVNNSDIISISSLLTNYGTGSPKKIPSTSPYYNYCADADADTFIKNSDIIKISSWLTNYGSGSPKKINCPHSYN